ncbi:MAG: HD domain-containing protein [Anaerolineaceae bacterium]|nr:HD domain-containing protein [Anaerolineaceae bacterium]
MSISGSYNAAQHSPMEGDFDAMNAGKRPGGAVLQNSFPGNGKVALEKMDGLYTLSRQLVATNSMETLLDSIVRHAVDIIQVSYCRVLTQEADGSFVCQAAYQQGRLGPAHSIGRREPRQAEHIYRRVLMGEVPILFDRLDERLTAQERAALRLTSASSICLVPLLVDSVALGILVLGKERGVSREPFHEENMRLAVLIADQTASAISRARLNTQLASNYLDTVLALAKTLEARDPYTGNHSQRMTDLAESLSRKLGLSDVEIKAVRWAALLHDIGKIAIPDEILRRPGPLTKEEWVIVRKHPEIGAEILMMVPDLSNVAELVKRHHERINGAGYPTGLKGNEIPLGSRILAVLDAYSAMTDGRAYRTARTHEEAITELSRCAGSEFDPLVVDAFLSLFTHKDGKP